MKRYLLSSYIPFKNNFQTGKIYLMVFFSVSLASAYSQNLPADSLILKNVFGKYDKNGKSYARALTKEEAEYAYRNNLAFGITYKANITLNTQNYLFVIIEAPYFSQHGHSSGYRNFYFFQKKENKWIITNSIVSNENTPLGDLPEYGIVDIGKNDKKALIITFQSTGNQHFEKTISLNYLTLEDLPFLMQIELEYSNASGKAAQNDDEECNAIQQKSTYKPIESDKEWFDVQVHTTNYTFTRGCKTKIMSSEKSKTYSFDGKRYTELAK